MRPDNKIQIDGRQRSLLIETACELADMIMTAKYGIPIEDMCNGDGEFTETYQCDFDNIYDRVETILTNLWERLNHGTGGN